MVERARFMYGRQAGAQWNSVGLHSVPRSPSMSRTFPTWCLRTDTSRSLPLGDKHSLTPPAPSSPTRPLHVSVITLQRKGKGKQTGMATTRWTRSVSHQVELSELLHPFHLCVSQPVKRAPQCGYHSGWQARCLRGAKLPVTPLSTLHIYAFPFPPSFLHSPTPSYISPTHSYVSPTHSYVIPTHSYVSPTHSYVSPTHSYVSPSALPTAASSRRSSSGKGWISEVARFWGTRGADSLG